MITNSVNSVPLSKYFKFANISTPSPSFDPTKPQKHWAIGWGDVTGPTFTYDCVSKDAKGYPYWDTRAISVQDALTPNVFVGTLPAGTTALPEIPTPVNKQAVMAAGLDLCTDFMGQAALCAPVAPENVPIQFTTQDHAILVKLDAWLAKQS